MPRQHRTVFERNVETTSGSPKDTTILIGATVLATELNRPAQYRSKSKKSGPKTALSLSNRQKAGLIIP
jgi:hypothetical protein